ncbi:thiol reductase thioredoxin [endosymbiont 'TC1' of Trimyema compressum]|uniref:thioredoxin n=1 Tax=endosymbiont 'TC1' of Trimyema compressum TaxID=243899 RepID=UPI0007F07C1C|nr:thioredoxin [endosymbiont 'TC1' of Trimyema compressum]AMP20907.1 thiol reductase thioredoxin [endosymbiont 'TC1' of Trimyema compressum]
MVEHITDNDFRTKVLEAKGLVLVDFWATWCGPCQMLGPVLEDLSAEMENDVSIMKLNVDENPITRDKYEIMSIPTMLIFNGGNIVDTIVGFVGKDQIKNRLLAVK